MQAALLAQRGTLIHWVPIFLGIGIGGYFALRFEPGLTVWMGLASACAIAVLLAQVLYVAWRPMIWAVVLICVGAGLAKGRTSIVEAPVLGFRYYGPIEGRVVAIDRSSSDAVRLTLDRVRLDRFSPDRVPVHVRVSLHGDQPLFDWGPGDRVILTGHLSPPSGPAEPGGFDFRRHAWFERIGAVGYTRTPVLRAQDATLDAGLWVFDTRMALSSAIQARMPGDIGAFAAAILTGDRSGIPQQNLTELRRSNLAHLLAISGLHMGLLTAVVFSGVRVGLCLCPPVALRIPVKKIAAIAALLAGAVYLVLSGGSVATQRAFIMVAVMFLAVLLDRRALTLRAVAIAATIVLLLRPEALTGPGFQMSFAATAALVIVFRALRSVSTGPRWIQPVVATVLSSLIAGLATAPFAAAHFNQVSHYGLIANLASVPLMGTIVMPAAVLAACLAPIGLAQIPLWVMGKGLAWVLLVAENVSSWDGAVSYVPAPPPFMLPILALSLLWVCLWRGRLRWAGCVGVCLAATLWLQTSRPDVLIADSGGLIGRLTPDGRSLSKPKGDGFVAGIWLENDGAPVDQIIAAQRDGISLTQRRAYTQLGVWKILQIRGKTDLENAIGCDGADILILTVPDQTERPCQTFDVRRLRETGALALSLTPQGDLTVTTVASVTGRRPWSMSSDPIPPAPLVASEARSLQSVAEAASR